MNVKSVSNPDPKPCNTQCASCKVWYNGGTTMHEPSSEHDPKETIKEHATDKFTEEKVEREVPDTDEPAQETIRETETHTHETTVEEGES